AVELSKQQHLAGRPPGPREEQPGPPARHTIIIISPHTHTVHTRTQYTPGSSSNEEAAAVNQCSTV
uniref:Uncharacterized protein n=1 Tax=Anopheles albimanus TaxID=7167 RepID=A0A182FZB6_ANOAL